MTTAVGVSALATSSLLEVGAPDEAENLSHVVEDLDGGRGIVHRGRERSVRDVDDHPYRERGSCSNVRSSPSAIIP